MTTINYKNDGNKTTIDMNGKGGDLFKAGCRIVNAIKKELKMNDADFEKIFKEGMKAAELEVIIGQKNDSIDELLDVLSKVLKDD